MSDQIQIQQDGRILRITFNRPEGNGVSDSMAAALSDAVMKAHETSDCVVLRSVGPDFCTGRVRDADFPPSPEAYSRRPEYDSIFNSYKALRSCLVPVIGVIEGKCMGFGTAIAALCDVSFASDKATFNIPEIAHNVMPTMVMSAIYDRMLSRPRPAILGLKEYLRVAPRMDEQGAIDYARSLHSMVNTSAAMKKKAH
jgi:enoyl-CoA hydratase